MDRHNAERLRAQFQQELPEHARAAVGRIIVAAAGTPVYAVGGVVRDLLLGRRLVDVDLVLEGDAIATVREALHGERATTHARFGTASVSVNGTRIDVAMARAETYARPGALPDVAPAAIEADLLRRDFTMNALALRLDGDVHLLDPTGGAADIEARTVRVLHDGSFTDDATRILRAFRYAARLGFVIDPHTRRLLDAATAYIATIGGERIRREFELMLLEESASSLETADAAGALAAVHPALAWDDAATAALAGPVAAHVPRVALGFALLAHRGTPAQSAEIIARLRLKRGEATAVEGVAALTAHAATLQRPDVKPSGVVVLLDRYAPAAVAAFAVTTGDAIAGQLALRYLETWRHEKPRLSGRDLQAMGVPAGPNVQRGLQLIRAARLDGWAPELDDERALAMRFAKSISDSTQHAGAE